jgi:phage terminase large subunit GpA-like protein
MALSEWSDTYAHLSAESAAEAGKWTTLSYQKGIMDACTDPNVEWVVVMKSARVGYTKILNNLIGYHIHQDPCPIMVVQPTVEDAEGYSKEEIAPMIRDTPALHGLVSEAKAKNGQNTILAKSYPGGTLSMVGANSPRGFRRVSRRLVTFDEVDGYPPGGAGPEGDQIKLGARRSEYYWNRKLVAGSTPTIEGVSKIAKMYEDTDQRRYFVPCPHCGEYQYLKWGGKDKPYGIKWPSGKPDEAYYLCEHNGCIIEHESKVPMLDRGEWRTTAPAKTVGPAKRLVAGFHIWAAYSYSPNSTWGHLASEFLDSKDYPLKLKTFVNTVLGETWKELGETRNASELKQREEDYQLVYNAQVPSNVATLTAAADVQQDRIEVGIKGWTPTMESYLIHYEIIYGDTSDKNGEVWDLLDEVRLRQWKRADGVAMTPPVLVIDTGNGQEGYLEAVYNYAKNRQGLSPRVFAIKGVPRHADNSLVHASAAKKNTIRLYTIATHAIKHVVSKRLDTVEHGPGAMHFPAGLDEEYYRQLTAEKFVTEADPRTGEKKGEWLKVYDRNEALDIEVYNVGCLYILQHLLFPRTYGDLDQLLKATQGEQPQVTRGRRIHSRL